MSDEFENAGRARRIWIIAGVVVALVLALGAAAWLGRPAYRHFKEERSLKQARAFQEKGDLRNTLLSLRAALAANPKSLEATRRMADLLSEAQPAAAVGWRRRMVELAPSVENRVLLASTALRVEKPPFPMTAQTLDELRVSGAETNISFHLVSSQLALRLNRVADAVAHLEAAAKLDPTNRLHQLNLATLRLRHTNSVVAQAARQELSALTTNAALAEHALRSLVTDALMQKQVAEAARFSTELVALPKARFDDRLQHLGVLSAARDPQTNACLAQLQAESATNATKAALVLGWLAGRQRVPEALAWVGVLSPDLRTNPPVALVVADCHLLRKDWVGLDKFLADQNWDDQEALRLALLTRVAREQDRRDLADSYWRRVLNSGGPKGEFLASVAQLVAAWGWAAEAEEVLWALVRRAPWQDLAWQALIGARTAAADTPGLYRVYSALLETKPNAPVLKNNVAAIGLLLDRDTEKCARLAREVYLVATNNATFASTHAFALHRQGRTADALQLLETFPEKELQRPGVATYYAVLLGASGQRDKAVTYAAFTEKGQPLPEEKRLLEAARAVK